MDGESIEQLTARVRLLADLDEIESLKARYWRAIDAGRVADVGACLLAECVVDYDGVPRCESREAFLDVVRTASAQPGMFHVHHGHNPVIGFLTPDHAAGTWEIFYHGIDLTTRTIVQMAGTYQDSYARRAGRWWIATTLMRRRSVLVQHVDAAGAALTGVVGR